MESRRMLSAGRHGTHQKLHESRNCDDLFIFRELVKRLWAAALQGHQVAACHFLEVLQQQSWILCSPAASTASKLSSRTEIMAGQQSAPGTALARKLLHGTA